MDTPVTERPCGSPAAKCQTTKGSRTWRGGKVLGEFLLQRGFALTKDAGSLEEHVGVVLSNILDMSKRKKTFNFLDSLWVAD